MSLDNLTASGWLFFAWTLAGIVELVVSVALRKPVRAMTALLLALEITWVLWLVTP